jgi:alkylated DNA repair dioxygenase AlkB
MGHASLFGSESESSPSSASDSEKLASSEPTYVRITREPPIEGLYIFRNAIPLELQEILLRSIIAEKAVTPQHPQAMLFPRNMDLASDLEQCPGYLKPLIEFLPHVLRDKIPSKDYAEVFDQSMPLQTIINLYEPGQGISPHVTFNEIPVVNCT